ncbi:hypothetical protein [Xylophilus sp.]|uniref:hypothetical protein n=1 Tax=Xylophilus sp. TaxID=2653893 RepID=UPI0013BACDDC|nr:hypothetical protein [Xylophilus sp.]KAF1047673.1 MAG: hypothetical protein GAK38_01834 [Xylophilus sp.]
MSALPVSPASDAADVRPGSPKLAALFAAIAEGASQRDAERVRPFEAVGLLRRARFGALRLLVAVGGAGASLRQLIAAVIALGAADPNVAHILRNHFAFVDRFVLPLTATQPGHPWVRAVAAGAIFGLASGELSTSAVGNGALDTPLTPNGQGGWRVEGVKYYSTGSL